jgi:phage recombination protein Bet
VTTQITKKSELTIRLENRGVDPMLWNAIGASIFPGASDESKLLAIDYCKSRGLDIMKKPCHIVPMNVKDAKTGAYGWRDIIMPGIAEIRITAARTGEYAGQDAPIFGPMVNLEFGKQMHWVPEFCTITVYRMIRSERVAFSHTEFFEEACNTKNDGSLNAMWAKRKRGQLTKCAEAGALRKGFPEETGGIIVAEEADDQARLTPGRVVEPLKINNASNITTPFEPEPVAVIEKEKPVDPQDLTDAPDLWNDETPKSYKPTDHADN